MNNSVQLRTAYYWDCAHCKNGNFVLPEIADLDKEERAMAFREVHDIPDDEDLPQGWEEFMLVYVPTAVTCSLCSKDFIVDTTT